MKRLLSVVMLLFLSAWGCSGAPSETTVAAAITDYFERAHYRVADVKIGKIEGIALSQKTYMGTPGYIVDIVSITLDPQTDKGADIRKGRQLTFTNARIRVKEDATDKTLWHVSIISGIPVL